MNAWVAGVTGLMKTNDQYVGAKGAQIMYNYYFRKLFPQLDWSLIMLRDSRTTKIDISINKKKRPLWLSSDSNRNVLMFPK